MNETLNIVSTASALPSKRFVQFLNAFENHQTFSQKANNELEATLSLISSSVNSHNKKHDGLLLLKSFLTQCQLDVIEQKGQLWLSLCIKVCAQKKPAATVSLACDIINDILAKSVHIPDLGKAISSNLLSKIIESLNGLPPECHLAALKCLENCMKHYAGPSGSSKGAIERFLGQFVDNTNRAAIIHSGKCLLQLQQVRGGSAQGTSVKSAWTNLQSQILGSLHTIMNQLFANAMETYDGFNFDEEITTLKVAELNLSPEPVERATQLMTRFCNLCEYLRIALCEPFTVTKAVQPGLVFSIISRGLAVNCSTLSKNAIIDNVAVAAVLPQIHISLFQLLDSMILLLRTNLLPFANNICHLIVQSLKWTSSGKACGFKRPYISIRQAAYHTLSLWCKTAKYGSLVETFVDDFIKYIIQDITPYQNEVTLKVLAGSRKYLSKKARQKLHKAQNDASNIAQTHSKSFNPHNTKIIYSDNGNEPLAKAALDCLVEILHASGCFIKPLHQKILQENIVSLSLNVANANPAKSHLYYNVECRKSLFAALYALTQSPHHLCPPPIQYAAEIFRIAQVHDTSAEIRDACSEFSRGIEKILHPQKEILYFPTNANEVAEAFKKDAENARTNLRGLIDGSSDSASDDDDESSDIEMDEIDSTQNKANESIKEPTTNDSVEVTETVSELAVETPTASVEVASPSSPEPEVSKAKSPINETLSIVIDDDDDDKEELSISPPRKSARLEAKRRDSNSENEICTRKMSESPVPKRRSMRLNSTSSQDAPPANIRDESIIKKMPTITENEKISAQSEVDGGANNEKNNTDQALVDELAAAFVEEFIE